MRIILWHIICPCQLLSQNNHLPWQIFFSKALRWQTTYQSIPTGLDQGNYKESMWNTQRISLNKLLLMRKVYIQNRLLLLPILPRLHLWILKWVVQLNNQRKDWIALIAPLPVTKVFTRPHLGLTRLMSQWSTTSLQVVFYCWCMAQQKYCKVPMKTKWKEICWIVLGQMTNLK